MPSTFSCLNYHIVFATKFRQPLLRPPLLHRMHEYLGGCIRQIGATPLQIGGIEDHVHILARLKPTHCVADVLRSIKKGSSDWARSTVWSFQWQDGYSAFTVSPSHVERVTRYIATQAEHHHRTTFEDEYRALLAEHGIEYDERFVL